MTNYDADITDTDIIKYLLESGIPKQFTNKERKLNQYGETGDTLTKVLFDPDRWRKFFEIKSLLNLYSENLIHEEVAILIIRYFLLISYEASVLTLPEIYDATQDQLKILSGKKAVAIMGFYNPGFKEKPFTKSQQFIIEEFIKNRIRNGEITILASNDLIEKHEWYTLAFRNGLDYYGRNMKVDTRN